MCLDTRDGAATLHRPSTAALSPNSVPEDAGHSYTAPATEISGEFGGLQLFHPPSPTFQSAETSTSVAYAPQTSTAPVSISRMSPFSQIQLSTHAAASVWPTPPATACEDSDDYLYQRSPASAGRSISTFAARPTPSCTTSPRTWPSPDATSFDLQQGVWKSAEHMPIHGMSMQSDASYVAPPHYAHAAEIDHRNNIIERDSIFSGASALARDHSDSVMSRSTSPGVFNALNCPYPVEEDALAQVPGKEGSLSDGDEASRGDEPYAQLIYRAFMSTEQHSMTLQEIYAWFRENTDRAKAGNKGWQNSIRHNLSMNAAFVRRVDGSLPRQTASESGESKKTNEWFLEEWAVQNGVQSTTRYRKGNPGRRSGPGARGRREPLLAPGRGYSGRKGGLMASKTKGAAHRSVRIAPPQQCEKYAPSAPLARTYSEEYRDYSQPTLQEVDCASTVQTEPVTPLETSVGSLFFSRDGLEGSLTPSINVAPGYCYDQGSAPLAHYHSQHHLQVQHFPYQERFPAQMQPAAQEYRLEDVSGIYNPQSTTLSTAGTFAQHDQQPPAPLHHLASTYSNLIPGPTNLSRNDIPQPPFRDPADIFNWDTGGNSPYQS